MNLQRLFFLIIAFGFVFFGAHARAQTASQLYTEAATAYDAGDNAAAKQKLRLALEIDKTFRPASVLLAKIAGEEKQAHDTSNTVSAKSLSQVILPVEFHDTSLQVAIETLRQRIAEKTGGKLQVNFVLALPPELANKKISLQLDHAPVTEVMRYLGSVAGVNFKIEPYAITVEPVKS